MYLQITNPNSWYKDQLGTVHGIIDVEPLKGYVVKKEITKESTQLFVVAVDDCVVYPTKEEIPVKEEKKQKTYKVGSLFKRTASQHNNLFNYYILVGSHHKKGSKSGYVCLASLKFGWSYTGSHVWVDDLHNITEQELDFIMSNHTGCFELISRNHIPNNMVISFANNGDSKNFDHNNEHPSPLFSIDQLKGNYSEEAEPFQKNRWRAFLGSTEDCILHIKHHAGTQYLCVYEDAYQNTGTLLANKEQIKKYFNINI